ncbi:MAG: phenylalanine--tRNA ligase subunit beta [Deltaproteobacteria bacterium]|nr:phenylalanine--tRNA ligase subunit beta [Deltaproteobacteria bacterium]
MKIPYSWLKEFVPSLRWNPAQVSERLTATGFEIESLEKIGEETILEIAITPNRGDCLSILGIAREVAAVTGVPLKRVGAVPRGRPSCQGRHMGLPLQLRVLAKKDCPRYAYAVLEKVRIAPSPSWLKDRLALVGIRSINNVVDATNYVLMERGQPLHAFDYHKIRGQTIIVRHAVGGEAILTLDNQTRELFGEDLVIADKEGAMAIAGVMGGQESSVTEATTTIVLESAFFNPSTVRRASRRLGLISDSSTRFERGVDFEGIPLALTRVVQLIGAIGGGGVLAGAGEVKNQKRRSRVISLTPERVNRYLGTDLKPASIRQSLSALGLVCKGVINRAPTFQVPSYRSDLTEDTDLIEELARFHGYEKIPTTLPVLKPQKRNLLSVRPAEKEIRQLLKNLGFSEAVSFSFVSPLLLRRFNPGLPAKAVSIANPISQEDSLLRPMLTPQIVEALVYNQSHQNSELRLFECQKVFSQEGEKVVETRRVAGILSGPRMPVEIEGEKQRVDFRELKGVVESLLKTIGAPDVSYEQGTQSFLHPGKSADLRLKDQTIGFLGALHPLTIAEMGIRFEPYLFEFDLDPLVAAIPARRLFQEVSRFPWVERDICLLVDRTLPALEIQKALETTACPLEEVTLFDLYQGKGMGESPVPEGKKSLAYRVRYLAKDRTLTDEEVNRFHQQVIDRARNKLGAEIR